MSEMLSVRIDPALKSALESEAAAEDRSATKQLERILRERYGSALAEREEQTPLGATSTAGSHPAAISRSASADKITAAGANGDQPNPPTTRVAAVKEDVPAPPRRPSSAEPGFRGHRPEDEGQEVNTPVVAHYHRHYCPYEEKFGTVDEAFRFLAYGEDSGNLSSGDVMVGEKVFKRGTPEHERLLFAARDALV